MSHSAPVPHLVASFSVPPPPLPNTSLSHQRNTVNQTLLVGEGQRLVDDFIKRKMIHSPQVNNQQLTLDYQRKMNDLKQLNSTLIAGRDCLTETEWQEKVGAIEQLSKEIDGLLSKLSAPQNKRRRRKKKLTECTVPVQGKLAQRLELHQKIDKWREARHYALIKEQELVENKKGLRKCLNDNLKRAKEAAELITKLQSTVDEKMKENDDNGVIDKSNQLIAVWQDALMEYRAERIELERHLGITIEKKDAVHESWFECLFGGSIPWHTTPLTTQELINIRCQWDSCISTSEDATAIPFFWVLPPTNSTPANSWTNCPPTTTT